jgi:hypothetical protein
MLRHEFVVDLFRRDPALLLGLLRDALGIVPPPHTEVRVCEADLTELLPPEARADLVLVFYADGRPVHALIVEIQLERDGDKAYVWPVYWSVERARLRCPVGMLVVALSEDVAGWAARTLTDGNPGGGALKPLVLGPSHIPPVTDEVLAEQASELAMMSLLAHADEPILAEVASAALEGIKNKPRDRARVYYSVIWIVLEDACRKNKLARAMMDALLQKYGDRIKLELFEIGRRWGESTGEARGEAKGIIKLLRKRGVVVDEGAEARILGCADQATLDRWFDRVLTVNTVQELFAE